MVRRPLGRTGFDVTPIGFGAFKIGRNEKTKYPSRYDLPDEAAVAHLLGGLLDMGVNLIDTAPAYGLSEQRIGDAIGHRRDEFVLSTKVGESFENGVSRFDFSAKAVDASITRSLGRLRTNVLDIVFVHSNGDDIAIQNRTDVVHALQARQEAGDVRSIGFSGKTPDGAMAALDWADVVMAEYHTDDVSHAAVMNEACERQIGVVVKKGLASGHLNPATAIQFVLENSAVNSLVIGGLNLDHFRDNIAVADRVLA